MKNRIIYILTIILAIGLLSCGNNNNSTPNQSTGDYYPTAINNTWYYYNGDTTVNKFISLDVFNGKNYYKQNTYYGTTQQGSNIAAKIWINKDNGDYVGRMDFSGDNGYYTMEVDAPVETIFLKDYLNAGDSWTENINYTLSYTPMQSYLPPYPDVTVNMEYKYTIVEKGASYTIAGQSYNDVIQIKLDAKDYSTSYIATTYAFYAKDVGIIRTIDDNGTGNLFNYQLY